MKPLNACTVNDLINAGALIKFQGSKEVGGGGRLKDNRAFIRSFTVIADSLVEEH